LDAWTVWPPSSPTRCSFAIFYVHKETLLSAQIEGTQASFSDLPLFESEEVPGVPLDDVAEVSCYVAAMNYGLQRLYDGFPLSLRLIREIHEVLLSSGRGAGKNPGEFRRSQNWIGGTRPGNARFVPPPPEHVMDCLGDLEKYLHAPQVPGLIKAAFAHVQFETIHPFLDGNGRLGRLLITLLLCSEGALNQPLLYLSLYLKRNRDTYYELLQQVRIDGTWSAGHIHRSSLHDLLPSWLTDAGKHRQAVNEEVNIYTKILTLTDQMTDRRERSKARLLAGLLKKNPLLIAFDSCLITLDVLKRMIEEETSACEVIVATGAKENQKRKVNRLFALGSEAKQVIALCSDAMAEGLNLQQASSVVLLDMPSVIRIAEQRVGRVDRMNSPHKKIEVWWPKDSEEFSLKADRKFYQRYTEVKEILGSNLKLPDDLIPEEVQVAGPSTAEEMIRQLAEMERAGQSWDGLRDAFQPVRELVDPGQGLVPADVYEQVRQSKAKVLSTVSLVKSKKPWAFMAVAGAEHGAPKWILLDHLHARPETDLEEVAARLRSLLGGDVETRPMDQKASDLIARFLNQVLDAEESLLPRKKQRALEEMRLVLGHYRKLAEQGSDRERVAIIEAAMGLLKVPATEEERPDLDAVAEAWLDLIRGVWYEKLKNRKRYKPLRLKDIRKDLKIRPLPSASIVETFTGIPSAQPIHTRVVSAIVGVPD